MKKKELICIECPTGCPLLVDIDGGKLAAVSGNKCPKGQEYAVSEIEDPRRILTSAVLCEGLDVRMLPVRTDKPIPKTRLMEAMEVVMKIRIKRAMKAGEVVAADFFGANLIATRATDALDITMRHK
jgi:CxxC motif-containing protein